MCSIWLTMAVLTVDVSTGKSPQDVFTGSAPIKTFRFAGGSTFRVEPKNLTRGHPCPARMAGFAAASRRKPACLYACYIEKKEKKERKERKEGLKEGRKVTNVTSSGNLLPLNGCQAAAEQRVAEKQATR
jgi:hypothetical protein